MRLPRPGAVVARVLVPVLLSVLTSGLVLAGCSSDDDPASTPAPSPTVDLWNPC